MADDAVIKIVLEDAEGQKSPGAGGPRRAERAGVGEPKPRAERARKPKSFVDEVLDLIGRAGGSVGRAVGRAVDMTLDRQPPPRAEVAGSTADKQGKAAEKPPPSPMPTFDVDRKTSQRTGQFPTAFAATPQGPTRGRFMREAGTFPKVAQFPAAPTAKPVGGIPPIGPAIAIAFAVLEVARRIRDAANAITEAAGRMAASLISASESPAEFVGNIGSEVKSFGDSLLMISPVASIFISNIGAMGKALSTVMTELDAVAERYGRLNPQVMQAQALGDIRQTLGDLRRGQEAAPSLVSYLQARSELQQKIEDTKIRVLTKITPFIIRGMEAFEKVLPLIEAVVEVVTTLAGLDPRLQGMQNRLESIDGYLAELNRPAAAELPTNLIRGNYPFTHAPARREENI